MSRHSSFALRSQIRSNPPGPLALLCDEMNVCSFAASGKRTPLIRQAISCDVCGVDMQQTNHWFIARQQCGELRISAWNSHIRSRAGAMHLCGQTCLHKLLDEFLAQDLAAHASAGQLEDARLALKASIPACAGIHSRSPHPAPLPTTLIPEPSTDEFDSSARLITPGDTPAVLTPLPPTSITSRSPHSDAWKREQARIQSESQSRPGRRRSIA